MAIKNTPKNEPVKPVEREEVAVETTAPEVVADTAPVPETATPAVEPVEAAVAPKAKPASEPTISVPEPRAELIEQLKEVEAKPAYPANLLPGHMLTRYRKLPTAQRIGIDRFLIYCDAMAPRKQVSPREIIDQQVNLFTALVGILNTREGFDDALNFLLALIQEPVAAALSERLVNREIGNLPLGPGDLIVFQLLVVTLRTLAPVSTRKALIPTVAFTRRVREIKGRVSIKEEALQRLDVFFNVD